MQDSLAASPVLVVAHSPVLRSRLLTALRERGVETQAAVGAVDAVRSMAPNVPSRIVVTSRLGRERGVEFAKMLSRIEKTARIPVLFVVGDHEGIKEARAPRVHPRLTPVTTTESVDAIVDAVLDPGLTDIDPPVRLAPHVEPGHVAALDAAFAFFDELLELIAADRLPGPVVPDLLLRVQQLFVDPNVDGRQVVRFVGEHQTLAARVLRMANSAYYGASSQVVSIDDAVTRIGLGKIKDTLQAVAALEYLSAASGRLRHAIGDALGRGYFVGMLSQALAEARGYDDPSVAFSVGLFHNIGVTFLLYGAAVLQAHRDQPLAGIAHLVTTGYHQSLLANRLLRRAMYLPIEVEALHGTPERTAGEREPDPAIVAFVAQAMWAADRVLPDTGSPLMADGEAHLIGLDPATIRLANPIIRKLLPMVATYRR